MQIFNKHISIKSILNILLGLAIVGMIVILMAVNRMNVLLSSDLGFNKDSLISVETLKSSIVLPDSLVFSSVIPGFKSEKEIQVFSEFNREGVNIAHQYVSDQYFDIFKYEKVNEKPSLFMNHEDGYLVYINESAVKLIGFASVDDATGTILTDENGHNLIICGVVKDFKNLSLLPLKQARIFQLSTDHLAYGFFNRSDYQELVAKEANVDISLITFQERIKQHYMIWEDLVYSTFLFINIFILLICLGHIGIKYANKKETELYKILSIGIHVITLVISKTYVYLLLIIGLVVGPMAYLIQKFWLETYINRVNFGLVDLFIILSMALLTVYLVCCPKRKLDHQLKGKAMQHNSI